MGIYDRQYYREEERSGFWNERSMVMNLVIASSVLFVVNFVLGERFRGQFLFDWMALDSDLFRQPWNCWQLVTYGFAHDPLKLQHVFFNMLILWMFGSDVEGIYGRKEFLRIYLTLIVVSGLVWALTVVAAGQHARLVGASGAVMGVVMLFVLHFPRRTLLLFGIIPMPAWAVGGLYLLGDLAGMFDASDHVAHAAHLSGAAMAYVYYRSGWDLGRLVPRSPRLKIHRPAATNGARDLGRRVDEILEKISREGESSLTAQERQTLEEASRRYQRRKQ